MTNEEIKQRLTAHFGDQLSGFEETFGMLTVVAPAALNLKIMRFLYDEEDLGFRFLTDLTAVHYPDRAGEELCVVYHLHNLVANHRLRFKVYVPIDKPDVFTATKIFPGATWMERESYDFFGVNFIG